MITLSFVIPIYNEEKRIKKTLEALEELRLPRGLKLEEIIFVDDGSRDNSKFKIQPVRQAQGKHSKLNHKYNIKLISYKPNRGKGYAVRQGMLKSTADYTLFFDADLSTPLSEIVKFVPFMKRGVDVIVGTRKNGESTVVKHQPFIRELLGRVFTKMTQYLLALEVTDFTCGFKAFSRKTCLTIFPQSRINGWGFDAEILFLAKKNGLSFAEKSVLWSDQKGSRVNVWKAIPQTLLDLLTIYWLYRLEFINVFAKTMILRYGKNIPSV